MRTVLALVGFTLVGCSSQTEPNANHDLNIKRLAQHQMASYPLHQYAGDIVMQMLTPAAGIAKGARVAVGTYVFAGDVAAAFEQDIAPDLGLQLQESLMTLLTQSGFRVIELRLADGINLTADAELLLNRQTMPAQDLLQVDYLLTGTVVPQQHAFIVNSRLIVAQHRQTVAAATTEIPRNVMWSRDSVQLRDGKLYRTGP